MRLLELTEEEIPRSPPAAVCVQPPHAYQETSFPAPFLSPLSTAGHMGALWVHTKAWKLRMGRASPAQHGRAGTGGRAMTCCWRFSPGEPPFPCCVRSSNRTSSCTGTVATLQRCRCPTGLRAASFQKPQLLKEPQQRSLKTLAAMAPCRNRWQPWQKRTAAPRGTAPTPPSSFPSGSCGESWMRTGTWHRWETNLKQVKYCLSREAPGLAWLHFSFCTTAAFHQKWLHLVTHQGWSIVTRLIFLYMGIWFFLLNFLLWNAQMCQYVKVGNSPFNFFFEK